MEIKEITDLGQSLPTSHDPSLVILSVLVAIIGSFTALDLARHVIGAKKLEHWFLLSVSAIALGTTIWAEHFIAILAYQLRIPITYDLRMLLISIVVAIVGAGIGLFIVTQAPLQWPLLGSGSFFIGLGIIGMHLTAMQAMLLAAEPKYNIQLMILADIWAILLSLAALWSMFDPSAKNQVKNEYIRQLISALIAGVAIAGMHYIAMAAVKFYPSVEKLREAPSGIDIYEIAITVGFAAIIIKILALSASIVSRRFSSEIAKAETSENFFNLAPDGFVTIREDGNIISANENFAKLMGYDTPEELIGTSAWDTVYQDDRKQVRQNVERIFQKKILETQEKQLRKVRKDGNSFLIAQRCRLVLDNSGNPIQLNISCRDLTQQKQMEAQLVQNATHDALTGLPNRVLFMDRLNLAMDRGKRNQNYLFAVLFLDLDRFKVVNDSLGHFMGDELLKAIATRLRSCVRPMDTIARLGGDEFTILLEDIEDVSDAIRVAERVQAELLKSFTLNKRKIDTSASIGIAFRTPSDDDAEQLLRYADLAMYQAKRQGGKRAAIFRPEMHQHALEVLQLKTDLRTALEKNEFCLHYQPIVSLEKDSIAGFEALLRWPRPDKIWSPDDFIKQAEQAGLIDDIGEWVLEEACSQLYQWQQLDIPNASSLTMSVNISGKQFDRPHLSERINQILQQTGLAAANLTLEIIEEQIMEDAAAKIIPQLKKIGIRLSIDDFGTGYSCLKRLCEFPIDELKIDRCFISDMENPKKLALVVKGMAQSGKECKLLVTAEGVETAEQLERVRDLEYNYVQGYFFSKPVDSKTVEQLLRKNPPGSVTGKLVV